LVFVVYIDEIITVEELEDRTFTNLENCIPNDLYNDDRDSISRYQMSIEDVSLTSNTKFKKLIFFKFFGKCF